MSIIRHIKHLAWAAVVFTAASCSQDDDNDFHFTDTTVPSSASSAATSRIEVPKLKDGNLFVAHWTREGNDSVMTYCLEYDRSKFHSRWVAFRFDGNTRDKSVSRKSYDIKPQYPADPVLKKLLSSLGSSQYIEDDASFNGYDHGHLCASADRLYSRKGNDNTFYMTNMSPQIGNFNSYYWVTLENQVQRLGRNEKFADTLYVVKGGTIEDGQIIRKVANNRMAVPKQFFMALLKVKNGVYSSIAFLMEHKDYGYNRGNYAPLSVMAGHAVSVDELEEKTGIDFFHNLPNIVEAPVEQQCSPSAWGIQ